MISAMPAFTMLKATACAGVANFNRCATESHHIHNRMSAHCFRSCLVAGAAQKRKQPTVRMMDTATGFSGWLAQPILASS